MQEDAKPYTMHEAFEATWVPAETLKAFWKRRREELLGRPDGPSVHEEGGAPEMVHRDIVVLGQGFARDLSVSTSIASAGHPHPLWPPAASSLSS